MLYCQFNCHFVKKSHSLSLDLVLCSSSLLFLCRESSASASANWCLLDERTELNNTAATCLPLPVDTQETEIIYNINAQKNIIKILLSNITKSWSVYTYLRTVVEIGNSAL